MTWKRPVGNPLRLKYSVTLYFEVKPPHPEGATWSEPARWLARLAGRQEHDDGTSDGRFIADSWEYTVEQAQAGMEKILGWDGLTRVSEWTPVEQGWRADFDKILGGSST